MQGNFNSGSSNSRPQARLGRPIAVATAIVFFVSLVFPVGAALSKNTASFPGWWGTLDVAVAFVLAIMVIALLWVAGGNVTPQVQDITYRAYRFLIHGVLVLLVIFLFFGDWITWINGLPGLAWRTWLLFYCLPAWFMALCSPSSLLAPTGPGFTGLHYSRFAEFAQVM